MLETLIASRIRRTLLEHILIHPTDRFYLRGLAKELTLSVSPVRRELKRLEQLGLLTAYDEGNMRFYTVNQDSPEFIRLKQATGGPEIVDLDPGLALSGTAAFPQHSPESPHVPIPPTPVVAAQPASNVPATVPPVRRWGLVVQTLAMMVGIVMVLGTVTYLALSGPGLLEAPKPAPALVVRKPAPTASKPSASGEMRSSRWRLVPGTVGGGFSSSGNEVNH